MPDDTTLDRQVGEITVEVKYMTSQIDQLVKMINKQQEDLDDIKLKMAELQGAKKFIEWVRALVAGIIGAIAAIVPVVIAVIGGKQ